MKKRTPKWPRNYRYAVIASTKRGVLLGGYHEDCTVWVPNEQVRRLANWLAQYADRYEREQENKGGAK